MKKTLLLAAFLGLFGSAKAQDFKWQAFYTQTYENVAKVSDVWAYPSLNSGKSTFELAEEENGNHYVNCNVGSDNGRGLYNLDELTADMYEGIDEYRVEFDLGLAPGNNQATTSFSVGSPDIQTMGSDWATPCGNITKYSNNGLGSGSLFSLIQESVSSTNWRVYSQAALQINGEEGNPNLKDLIHINLTAGTMYHFALTVSPANEGEDWMANVQAEVSDMEGNPVLFNVNDEKEEASVTLPYYDQGNGYWFKQFYCLMGRYQGAMMIDNVQVMKKVAAGSVTPPTLAMTGVQMEGRVIALDNGAEVGLTPYYALVDEETYNTAEDASALTGTEYTGPFVVSEAVNYIIAWNVDEAGKASELTKFTCEAGWAPQLNAPTISATDYSGRAKTFTATCDQSNVKPLAPQSYTIYMSADGENWTEGNTYTVTEGLVYAKVEADGYATAVSEPVEAPDGIYGSTKWTIEGMVITSENCPLFNFDNSGKGRVHVPVQYWSEDYYSEADEIAYDANNAWEPLRKNGMHFNGGTGDMFILGSGNASGFTITGLTVYNSNKCYIQFDELTEGDIIQCNYNDGTARIFTVNDPETFTVPVPQYGKSGALSSIEIKGAGTMESREVKIGEWGIVSSSRTVADIDHAGAIFYEHAYTIYNPETMAADTLLLQPVNSLEAGRAYIYQATSNTLELVTLAAEEPVEEQSEEQLDRECNTLWATFDRGDVGEGFYTMFPGGILMKNQGLATVPEYSGYFTCLDEESYYIGELDFKEQPAYEAYLEEMQKIIEDYENWEPDDYLKDENGEYVLDESGELIVPERPELDIDALWKEKYETLLSGYTLIPVVHEYNEAIANSIAAAKPQASALLNVVTPAGVVVRRGVKAGDSLDGLKPGLYIVGNKKLVIK